MKKIFTDMIDDFKCIKLTPKGWNFIATPILIIAALYWGCCSQYGDFFKVTGCIAYLASSYLWIVKSAWGQKMMEDIFDNNDIVPFKDEEE